jgi:hypothetical protein
MFNGNLWFCFSPFVFGIFFKSDIELPGRPQLEAQRKLENEIADKRAPS